MLDLFDKKSKELLGIDIGTKQIKMIELDKPAKKPILKNYAIIAVKDGDLQKLTSKEIADILKLAISQAKIKTKDTVMSLPAFSTFLALIKIPNAPENEEELDQLIKIEARKYIPVPLEEVSLGWARSNEQILLIAVPKDIVNRYGQIAQEAGLDLKALEAETFSLARSLASDVKESAVIIDAGAHSTNVSLIENGKVKMNRTLEQPNPEQIKNIINPSVKKIIFTGGKATQELISNFNNFDSCEIGNPWQNLIYPKELEPILTSLSPSFAVAIGLALRGFNG
ncbi:MAG: pilus assembly protein PilM [bacterium]